MIVNPEIGQNERDIKVLILPGKIVILWDKLILGNNNLVIKKKISLSKLIKQKKIILSCLWLSYMNFNFQKNIIICRALKFAEYKKMIMSSSGITRKHYYWISRSLSQKLEIMCNALRKKHYCFLKI